MRTLILVGWLLLPAGFGIWHYGPGQERVALDSVGKLLAEADRLAKAEEYAEAVELYDEALKQLPAGRTADNWQIRLERAKAQMKASKLPEAHQDLKALCEELQAGEKVPEKLLAETREALAQSHYYMTWLMRLEGEPNSVWEPEIESARQTYRLLAERAKNSGDEEAVEKNKEDLESAVRLARMDLSELQGLSLPCQCCGCCSGNCKKPGNKGKGKKIGNQAKDARGASSGPPPDGSGH